MLTFILRRVMLIPVSMILVALVVFVILRVIGDPAQTYLDVNSTPEQESIRRQRLHLDDPLPVRFAIFQFDIVRSDFGTSLPFESPDMEIVLQRLAPTVELISVAPVIAAIGGSALNLIIVLGVSGWMVFTRVTFGLTRTYKERPFVEAAVSHGAQDLFINVRHILPQIVPVLTVISTPQVAQLILRETALSFLGPGIPPPAATWGNMLAKGRDRMWVAPWTANLSGFAIIAVVWGVNMLGNGLREHLDPKSKEVR